MTVINLVLVALVAYALCGLFLGLAVVYRRRSKAVLRAAAAAHSDSQLLREELAASRNWNNELRDANTAVQHLVTSDPMHLADQLPQRSDPLEQLYLLPPFTPDHERGQQ
ncbi:hypothetical protein [Actinoplanes sp. NPDC049599]|uniref:hypothetical protein n=1 Tax=Actinoplanes sp. NPDC049599 TaxID=3363903 RepID=UPI0037A9C470